MWQKRYFCEHQINLCAVAMKNTGSFNTKAKLVAMVHVHSNNALCNTRYNSIFGTTTYSSQELKVVDEIRKKLATLAITIVEESGNSVFKYCRTASFILKKNELALLEEKALGIEFVKKLVDKALQETAIYFRNGIECIEIENVGAPYFIGNEIPLEDLFLIHLVAKSIRKSFPEINIGIQVLSCGELEALPIAIACNAFFVRSEASVFKGLRPEGEIFNRGNLAKFYYLRNYLNTCNGAELPENRLLPALWCDFQKKHTLFETELTDLSVWLDNSLFQKLEGIVITGNETGSAVKEEDLIRAKKSILHTKERINQLAGYPVNINLPLITGSGSDIEMYRKYADYMIVGTALKKNRYWENEVDESLLIEFLKRFDN